MMIDHQGKVSSHAHPQANRVSESLSGYGHIMMILDELNDPIINVKDDDQHE